MAPLPWNHSQYKSALQLQASTGLIDLHVDSIIEYFLFRYQIDKKHRPGKWGQPLFWHADIPRMIEGGFGGACMGIHYYPWESEGAWRTLNRQIDYLDRVCARDYRCHRIYNPDQWKYAKKKSLLALAPGVEGAHMLNGRLDRVAAMAKRGVAYLTLAHFNRNSAATPSIGRGADEKTGLTAFGRQLVHQLNEYGIAIDVAHVNTPGVLETCKLSRSPVLCTHTGVKGVYPSARNITDAEIDAIAKGGGVIGLMYAPNFLAGKLKKDSSIVLDHLDYVVKRVGVKHAALGSDFDGWLPAIPSDMRDCRDTVKLTYGLMQRGYKNKDIQLILRDNCLRVFQETWKKRNKKLRP